MIYPLLQHISIAAIAVIQITATIGIGAYIYPRYKDAKLTLKWLSTLCIRITLPLYLISELSQGISLEKFSRYFSAPFLALVPCLLGNVIARFLFSRWIPYSYQGLLQVICSYQNGLTYPLSIVLGLHGVPWLDDAAKEECISFMFLYNIPCSVLLWSFGDLTIQRAKEEEIREIHRLQGVEDASPPLSIMDQIKLITNSFLNPVVASSVIGIFLGLFPPTSSLQENHWVQLIVNGIRSIGRATIPFQLLCMGGNLRSSVMSPVVQPSSADSDELMETEVVLESKEISLWLFNSLCIALRLVILPLIFFLLTYFLAHLKLIPSDPVFLLAILIEGSAPSAINVTLICVLHDYKVNMCSKVILCMYLGLILTSGCWLSLFLSILN